MNDRLFDKTFDKVYIFQTKYDCIMYQYNIIIDYALYIDEIIIVISDIKEQEHTTNIKYTILILN